MDIQIDSREKAKAIQQIIRTFDRRGVNWFVSKLPVGDYISLDNARLSIDRKQNLLELCSNVTQQQKRFIAELERAERMGIQLIILCEHGRGIETLGDVMYWQNPRLKDSPLAVSGERLFRKLDAIGRAHNVSFEFCTKAQTGNRIIELLGGEPQKIDHSPRNSFQFLGSLSVLDCVKDEDITWCEQVFSRLCNDQRRPTTAESREIARILVNSGEWIRAEHPIRCKTDGVVRKVFYRVSPSLRR